MQATSKWNEGFLGRETAAFVWLLILGLVITGWPGVGTAQRIRLSKEESFIHPGILHRQDEIEFVRNKVKDGAEPWLSAWKDLREHRVAQLDWEPKPHKRVVRGAYNDPDIGSSELSLDSQAAYAHALQWAITRKATHARKTTEILNAYSERLEEVAGHDARLLVGMTGILFVNAAELMRHTYDRWEEPHQQAFEKLLRDVFYPVIKDFYPTANGNWDAAMIQTMMAMGVFLEDHDMFNRGVDYFLYGRGNGAVNHYISEKGVIQESGRDQGHTQMGLGYLSCAAEIGWKQGLDLYGAHDNRLARGYEYTARFNLGHEVPYEPFMSIEQRYYYPEISSEGRGDFAPIYERTLNHYRNRRDMEMPFTKEVVMENRPEGFSRAHVSWGTLMFANLPADITDR